MGAEENKSLCPSVASGPLSPASYSCVHSCLYSCSSGVVRSLVLFHARSCRHVHIANVTPSAS
eukprot:419525-Pyramimonas_sp.AAC.1